MRVLPSPQGAGPDPAGDWLRSATVRSDAGMIVHVTGSAEDAPRVAAVVRALDRVGAFAQIVLGAAGAELAELGVEAAVPLARGPERLDAVRTLLLAVRPVAAIIHGQDDVALAGALAAARGHVPVVRVGRAPEPEELGRLVDRLADLVLVHDERDAREVQAARVPGARVHVVGNPLMDVVRASLREAAERDACSAAGLAPSEYVLAILTGRTGTDRARAPLSRLAGRTRLVVIDAGTDVGFVQRLSLLRSAGAVVTNSERALEEAAAVGIRGYAFGLPASRLQAATTIDLGDDLASIAAVRPATEAPTPCAIPLWDGRAGARIADVMVANFARVRLLA